MFVKYVSHLQNIQFIIFRGHTSFPGLIFEIGSPEIKISLSFKINV